MSITYLRCANCGGEYMRLRHPVELYDRVSAEAVEHLDGTPVAHNDVMACDNCGADPSALRCEERKVVS